MVKLTDLTSRLADQVDEATELLEGDHILLARGGQTFRIPAEGLIEGAAAGYLEQLGDLLGDMDGDTFADLAAEAVAAAGTVVDKHFGFLDDIASYNMMPQALGGSVLRAGPDGRMSGLTIPIGQNGNDAIIQIASSLKGAGPSLAGRRIQATLVLAMSTGYSRPWANTRIQVKRGATVANLATTLVSDDRGGNICVIKMQADLVGDETDYQPYVQVGLSFGAAAEEYLVPIATSCEVVTTPSRLTAQSENLRLSNLIQSAGISEARDAAITVLDQAKISGFANNMLALTPALVPQAGAIVRNNNLGQAFGFTIPLGLTGENSILQSRLDLRGLGPRLAGRTVRVTKWYDTSAGYNRSHSVVAQVMRPGGTANLGLLNATVTQPLTNVRKVQFSFVCDGTETFIQDYIRLSSVTPAAADEFISLRGVVVDIVASPATTNMTLFAENEWLRDDLLEQVLLAKVYGSNQYAVILTVRPDGSGNFTTIKAAVESVTDATPSKKYKVLTYPGSYTDIDWFTKDDVDIWGTDRKLCRMDGSLPDNTNPVDIANHQTLWGSTNSLIVNMTITCRNMRYPYHPDVTSPTIAVDKRMRFINCWFEHYGNDGARAYQSANGGDPNLVWQSENAFGAGLASGCSVEAEDCTFKAPRTAFAFHNRADATLPILVRLNNCKLIGSNDDGFALLVQALGSGQNDRCVLNNCQLTGDIGYIPDPWKPGTLGYQPASHAEISISLGGNSPAVVRVTDFGRALLVASATTNGTGSVSCAGAVADLLFGAAVATPGGGGLAASLTGAVDVSGVAVGSIGTTLITSLGQRLGDCSTVTKTLPLIVDGVAKNVVFNANMTPVSNATILAQIQAVLGASGTVGLLALGERFKPADNDHDQDVKNTSATGIAYGQACAYDTSKKSVRLMTSADAASLFAGFASQDILPGAFGRVRRGGYYALPAAGRGADVLRTDAAAVTFGDLFGIDPAAAGKIKRGAGTFLRAIRSDAVELAA